MARPLESTVDPAGASDGRVIIKLRSLLSVKRGGNISRLLTSLNFLLVLLQDVPLDLKARHSALIGWAMSAWSLRRLCPLLALSILHVPVFVKTHAAMVAVAGTQVVLVSALWAMVR